MGQRCALSALCLPQNEILAHPCRRVNRFAGRTEKACYSGKQNAAISIHPKQFVYKQNLKQSNFIHLFCDACNGVKLL